MKGKKEKIKIKIYLYKTPLLFFYNFLKKPTPSSRNSGFALELLKLSLLVKSLRRYLKVARNGGGGGKAVSSKCHGGPDKRRESILRGFFAAEPGAADSTEAAVCKSAALFSSPANWESPPHNTPSPGVTRRRPC